MSRRLSALCGLLCLLFCSVSALTSYQITSQQQLDNGWQFELALSPASAPGPYGVDISSLRCTVAFETGQRVRVRLFDPNNTRYEVPSSVLPQPSVDAKIDVMDYAFTFDIDPFQIQITRKSDNHVLLDTNAQLIFEDQYIELTTRYAPSSTIVGFGERVRQMPLDHSFTHTLWNIDSGTPANQNLYGFHPFYMETLLDTHQAHGVFMRSSNGMDVELTTDGYLTYRVRFCDFSLMCHLL
jgi:alpha-glucosidase (family GH31 glycosyl hydrolase)